MPKSFTEVHFSKLGKIAHFIVNGSQSPIATYPFLPYPIYIHVKIFVPALIGVTVTTKNVAILSAYLIFVSTASNSVGVKLKSVIKISMNAFTKILLFAQFSTAVSTVFTLGV